MATAAIEERKGIFYGWYMIAGILLFSWVQYSAYLVSIGASTVPLTQQFGWSRLVINGGYSTGAAVGGFGSPIFGYLIDRFGPRTMLAVGGFFMGLGSLMLSLSVSMGGILPLWYTGWVVMVCAGTLGGYVGTGKVLSNWFLKQRGTWMGMLTFSGAFVYMMGTAHVLAVQAFGVAGSWLMWAIIAWVVLLSISIFLVRDHPQQKGYGLDGARLSAAQVAEWRAQRSVKAAAGAPPAAASQSGGVKDADFTTAQVLRLWVLWLLGVIAIASSSASGFITTQQIPYLQGLGVNAVLAGVAMGAMGLMGAPGRWLVGFLIDRFGKNSIRFFYSAGLVMMCIGLIFLIYGANMTFVWLYAGFYGFGLGLGVTSPVMMMANYFGARVYSTAYGIRIGMARIGTTVGPAFTAWIYDITGSYAGALWAIVVLLVVAAAALLLAVPPKEPAGAAAPATAGGSR